MNSNDRSGSTLLPLERFDTTRWSVVLLAGQEQSSQSAEALEKLCRTYWRPLYAFVRRRGYQEQDAEDLTQKFFVRLLDKRDLVAIDPRKGKFRTFLLSALTHFLSNERDYANAAKRGGGRTIIPLDEVRSEGCQEWEPASEMTPDKLFDTRWAVTVLEVALGRLREEMMGDGKAGQFDALKEYLTEEPVDGKYRQTAARLDMTTQAVAVAVYRLRQRYRQMVREEVAQTVTTAFELEQEMRHLLEALSG